MIDTVGTIKLPPDVTPYNLDIWFNHDRVCNKVQG